MKQEDKEELRMLAKRLYMNGSSERPSDVSVIDRYRRLAERTDHAPAVNDALYDKANFLVKEGRYCEALELMDEWLTQNPQDVMAHANRRFILDAILQLMNRMAVTSPESAEYGRTYERMIQVGHVTNNLHLGAVHHYLASGQVSRAVERLLLLAQIAPRAAGVPDAIIRAAKVSDDAKIQQLFMELERNAK